MWNVKTGAFASLVLACSAQWLPPIAPVIRQQMIRTVIVADFERRVDRYTALHRLLEAVLPPIVFPNSPAEVMRATARQRETIRRGRINAREGDVFAPRIAEYFRLVIAETRKNDFNALLSETQEQIEPLATARINERWPGAMLTMMPPDLLTAFPPLPSEVEYRFAHHDLVLWDVQVDLVVDVLRNAIPADDNPTRDLNVLAAIIGAPPVAMRRHSKLGVGDASGRCAPRVLRPRAAGGPPRIS
jgi:hypothetical protein